MQAVKILFGIYALEHRLNIKLIGHGGLHDNSVNIFIRIELFDKLDNPLLRNILPEAVGHALHAELHRGIFL